MPVSYILRQAGAKIGLNPSAQSSRNVLLRLLNEAAEAIYDQADLTGSLMEQVFKVNGDQTISLPWYVGEIRGIRETDSHIAWTVDQMRPRYNQFNWKGIWRNWRIKNTQALQATVTNESVGVFTVPAVESPPIVVTVFGPTDTASDLTEVIVMDAVSKSTVNQFVDYVSVTKDRVNNHDVTLSDVDGKLMTVIPNNRLNARYQIVDVSTCPWLAQNMSVLEHYVELLYKKTLPQLQNDGDEFPCQGFDNILVNKMIEIWKIEQGKSDEAAGYDALVTRAMGRKNDDRNKDTEDTVALVNNPHDTLLPRVRGRRPSRYYRRRY